MEKRLKEILGKKFLKNEKEGRILRLFLIRDQGYYKKVFLIW